MEETKCKVENCTNKNKTKTRRYSMVIIGLILQIMLTACTQESSEPITKSAFALDTIINITVYDNKSEKVLEEAIELIKKYENIYSRTIETSELHKLNNRSLPSVSGKPNTFEISDELRSIIEYGLEYSNISDGAFDITVEPVTSLWDFKSENPKLPDESLIKEAINKVGYEGVILEGNTISFKNEDIRIELGAIAKGYIADMVKEHLESKGVESGIINLGGNVLTLGEKNNKEPFKIGIQKPFASRNEIVASMDIVDKSVVTSGIYERYFVVDNKTYHHILNPDTGFPFDNELISVTIISPKSVDGDGLSTTCFALGLDQGMDLVNSLDNIHAIFITKDYDFYYSEGFFEDINVEEIKDSK
ncbi:MAG: FAD:protein FMN transferase [Clostridiales bacterium]|nr:FAD:protein FMN transferase [Clostridiales bacterium]